MGLFGTQAVRILGPLTIDGMRLSCPECGDDGQQIGHTVTASGKNGLASVTCGANSDHAFAFDGLTIATVNRIPRKGRFALKLDGRTVGGIAARPGTGSKKTAKAGKGGTPSRALAKQAAPTTKGKGSTSGEGVGLGGVLVAGLNTVSALAGTATATVGAVGQVAGAAASTVNAAARVGTEGISLARDSVKAGSQALGSRRRSTPKRAL